MACMRGPFVHAEVSPICPYTWTRSLSTASVGEDVHMLQRFLNMSTTTRVAESGLGSPGLETTKFGGATKKAVALFQEQYADKILVPNGLRKGTGKVGEATRATLNALCAFAPLTTTSASSSASISDTLTVVSATQPTQTLAPANALYVPLTNITLSAGSKDVEVRSIAVSQVGPGSTQAFADLDLLDDTGAFLGLGYFDAQHRLLFKKPFIVPAGTSRTLNIVADMAGDLSAYDGQLSGARVDAVEASSPISATFPIVGTLQKINSSLTIGAPTTMLSSEDPNTARVRYINDADVTFSGIGITANSVEDVKLTSIAWRQSGSASPTDIQNVRVMVNGTAYPTTVDDRSYSASFEDGVIIRKGMSVDVSIKGDLTTTGTNRTVQFDIFDGGDIGITGLTYGYGIFPAAGGNTGTSGNSVFMTSDGTTDGDSLKPYFVGSVTTISNSSASYIGK